MGDFRYQRSARCDRMGYEDDLLKYLNTVITEADKRIVRGQQRLLMANTEHTIVSLIFYSHFCIIIIIITVKW